MGTGCNTKNKKILLVDDSLLTSKIVSKFLNENGYETEFVETGEEAIQTAYSKPDLDLILMDIELSGKLDGIEAARSILKFVDIPIIFFTGNSSLEIIDKIKEVKAYGFVLKGMDKVALLSTMEMAFHLHEANTHASMYHQIFVNLVHEVYIFESDTFQLVGANCTAMKNTGYTEEELRKMTFLDIKPELDVQSFYHILNHLSTGEQKQFYTVQQRKDGTFYPVEIHLQLLQYSRKKLYLALAIDLTEHSAMKEKLNERGLLLDAIINSAQDAIIMANSQNHVILWNNAAERIFGYTKEDILGANINQLSSTATDKSSFKKLRSECQNTSNGRIIEMTAKHRNGQALDIEASISFLRIKQDFHALGLVRDISKRKQALKELAESRKQYFELAENAPIGIVKCDRNGKLIYVNQKAIELLDSPCMEKTKKINLLTHPALVEYGFSQRLERCLENNEPGVYEMNYVSIWGKQAYMRLHIKPLAAHDIIIGAQIIMDDITEKKRLEEELRSLSLTDPLTNVYNRRYFIQTLQEELARLQRQSHPLLCLVMLDLDHFKKINDRLGHNFGDVILKTITKTVKNGIRDIDCLARWGGEEFVIILPNTKIAQAFILVENLRKQICELTFSELKQVTASFGIAEYTHGDTVDSLVQKADKLMYEAKAIGRNCVCC